MSEQPSSPEGLIYASSILLNKSPSDSIEALKLRLDESKEINAAFISFFEDYLKVQESYAANLSKILLKGSGLFHDKTKFSEEIETLGLFEPIWNSLIGEINTELNSFDTKARVIDVGVLKKFKAFDKKYSGNSKNLNSLRLLAYKINQLEKITNRTNDQLQELSNLKNEWSQRSPNFFEIVESYDYSRLLLLKDAFLQFQTSNQDSLPNLTKQVDKSLEFILNFEPTDEIKRFSEEINKKQLHYDQSDIVALISAKNSDLSNQHIQQPPKVPEKHNHHTGGGLLHRSRQASAASTVKSTSSNANNTGTKANGKEKGRLKRFSSILGGRKKNKDGKNASNKNFNHHDAAIEESPSSSTNNSTSSFSHPNAYTNTSDRRTSDIPSTLNESVNEPELYHTQEANSTALPRQSSPNRDQPQPHSAIKAPINSFEQQQAKLTANSQPLTPSTNTISPNYETAKQVPEDTILEQPVLDPRALQQQQQAQGQTPIHVPPPVPAARSITAPSTATPTATSTSIVDQQTANSETKRISAHHNPLPPPPPANPRSKRDINSALFANLKQSDLQAAGNPNPNQNSNANNNGVPPLAPPEYKSISASSPGTIGSINRQVTGSSLQRQSTGLSSIRGGESAIHHPDLTLPGLNASVAEVIDATFRDGKFEKGNVLGEVAFSYILQNVDSKLPSSIRLALKSNSNLGKIITNFQFLKQLNEEGTEFEIIDPNQIHLKTIGGIKYSTPLESSAIVIHPIWRFEPHQASVVINIKLSDEVLSKLPEGTFITLNNLIASISVTGAVATSAASRPPGSFNKEKSRVTWVYRGPVVLGANKEERIVARFMTEGVAKEGESGCQAKFSINDADGAGHIVRDLELHSRNVYAVDPFSSGGDLALSNGDGLEDDWKLVPCFKTAISGQYEGHS
ncbi:hypothetical protein PACTADRAFT_185495 [Pachysolen tannophilus NRRL Y-2460]|uniref:MHD domain-containing protein n=1 Tax=Pachysolen tannophilus NRRL Y-2460 TaxID=669874 RepID=A0A1E4U269_PACTA|nr:hypothetical protein PACTADRAFT_185495 [Pachysolen tannophilus NRRL Y-2460]